ncbi:MAG: thioredoxin-dependent thiol peroxidase [Cyclobacteriaceae bacterium]|nr:thioredoxin-dependent thiol peroxidase [Cyclobacteriaceae bacterium]MCH8516209.1 thioredoxin-dependent thiol peroxidase [Cyclobacteriaceae bacterium]
MSLEVGDVAPDFTARDQDDEMFKLSDYRGKKVILYFYPKDNTPGCTAQACNLRDHYDQLQAEGYEVLGVSTDSSKSHRKFIEKQNLPFRLIADEDKAVHELYGTWAEKKMYGKTYMGTVRTTFVIDEEGKISEVIGKVKTKDHTNQIIK